MTPRAAPPAGLLFDLADTILREDSFDREAGTRRVLELARNPKGLSARDVMDLVVELEQDLLPRRGSSLLELSPGTVHRLVYEPNGVSFERSFAEVELEFWKAAARFSPTPGVRELIERLAPSGIPLGIVSNSTFTGEPLRWELEQHALLEPFRFVMSSADYVVRKPHPRIFLTAAQKLGCSPESTWFAGDSLGADVHGSRGAGMVSVWFNPNGHPIKGVGPHIDVQSWAELAEQPGLAELL